MNVKYVYQDLANIPAEFSLPAGRVKPWGTAHAIWSCKDLIDGPFAVINADDYYGVTAYKQIYDFLLNHPDGVKYNYAMVGYYIENTLTENGHVARGVCQVMINNCWLIFMKEHKLFEMVQVQSILRMMVKVGLNCLKEQLFQ